MKLRHLLMPLALTTAMLVSVNAFAQGAFPAPLPNQQPASSSPFPPVNGAGGGNAAASPFPPVGGAPARTAAAPAAPAAAAPSAFDRGAAPVGGGFGNAAPSLGGGGGGGPAGGPSAAQQDCMKQFAPLREDAEKRANAVRAASERKASPQEACKLIGNFHAAEAKLVSFVSAKQSACGIPPEVPKQMKTGHARTSQMLKQVCAAANGAPQGGPQAPPSLAEALGGAGATETRAARRSGGSTFDTLNGNVLER